MTKKTKIITSMLILGFFLSLFSVLVIATEVYTFEVNEEVVLEGQDFEIDNMLFRKPFANLFVKLNGMWYRVMPDIYEITSTPFPQTVHMLDDAICDEEGGMRVCEGSGSGTGGN